MEVLLAAGCGVIAWACTFACLGGGGLAGGVALQPGYVALRLERLCVRLSSTRLVDALSALGPWRQVSDELARRVARTGLCLVQPASSALLLVVCGLATAGVTVLSWSWAGIVVGLFGSGAVVVAISSSLSRRRRAGLAQEMPEIFRTLAVALGSGQTMPQAIEHVGLRSQGYASESFSKAALMLRCGSSVGEALESIKRELSAPGVGMLTTALRVSHTTGSPLRDLFMRSARLVERTSEFERLLAVKTAQVRLSVRIVCVLPVALVALLSVISPDFRQGLLTPAGMGSVLVAAAMDGVALLIVRRLVKEVI